MNLSKLIQYRNWPSSKLKKKPTFNSLPAQFISTTSSRIEFNRRKQAFKDALPEILNSVTNHFQDEYLTEVPTWITEVLEYNLAGGKLLRGVTTAMAYEMFEKPENLTNESLKLSRVMGWCAELIQTNGLMLDDIMDKSVKRRNAPCWYTVPHVGLRALNDCTLLLALVNHILNTHFGRMPQYYDFMGLINEYFTATCIGQHVDYCLGSRKNKDYSCYNLGLYNTIVTYKSAYSIKLPVFFGMLLANSDKSSHGKVEEICLKIGCLFQIQDDFIDVFGLESETGKSGTDIQDRKCTWLAVTALEHCSDAQRKLFNSCYGSWDPAAVQKIKLLYEDLNIREKYLKEEHARYNEIVNLVNNFEDSTRATELFFHLLNFVYHRSK